VSNKRWIGEILVAAAVVMLGILGFVFATRMPRGTPHESPGLTPTVISSLLILLGSILLVILVQKRIKIPITTESKTDQKKNVNLEKNKRILITLGLTIAYVIMLGKIPYSVATFLYVFVFLLALKSTNWIKAVGISVLVSLGLTYVFGELLRVVLP